jgi:outer membrane receptor protein involved in Fe transport
LTLGLSADDYNQASIDREKINPKIGLQWNLTDRIRLRAAAFRTVKPMSVANRSIQPTQVAGFDQFFDEVDGTVAWRYGLGLDARITPNLLAGIEISARDLTVPTSTASNLGSDWRENLYRTYVYWTPRRDLAVSSDLQVDFFESDVAGSIVRQVETWSLPFSVFYFHPSGFFAGTSLQLVYQKVDSSPESAFPPGSSDFAVVDAVVGYRFPHRYGMISLDATNLFDTDFKFQDNSFLVPPTERAIISPFIPERRVLARFTLNF